MQAAVSGLDLVLDHSDIYNYSGGMDPRRKPYKSWRKKYRKLKLQFDAKMKESDEMFKQEHRAVEVVRRLQESNHQLLEMLADLHWLDNDRQVLDMIERGNLVADKVEHIVTDTVQAVENHARGNTSFDEFKWNLVRNACVSLEDVPAVELRAICLDDEDMTPINYMKPSHEDEYLATLDASLDNQLPLHRLRRPRSYQTRSSPSAIPLLFTTGYADTNHTSSARRVPMGAAAAVVRETTSPKSLA